MCVASIARSAASSTGREFADAAAAQLGRAAHQHQLIRGHTRLDPQRPRKLFRHGDKPMDVSRAAQSLFIDRGA